MRYVFKLRKSQEIQPVDCQNDHSQTLEVDQVHLEMDWSQGFDTRRENRPLLESHCMRLWPRFCHRVFRVDVRKMPTQKHPIQRCTMGKNHPG